MSDGFEDPRYLDGYVDGVILASRTQAEVMEKVIAGMPADVTLGREGLIETFEKLRAGAQEIARLAEGLRAKLDVES